MAEHGSPFLPERHEWLEDKFYGRYEVTLTVDVGGVDAAMRLRNRLEDLLASEALPGLGHRLEVTTVLAREEKRRG